MKKIIVIGMFIALSFAACYRIYARGGDSFAGGMAGGMFGGLIGGSIASNANRSNCGDEGSSKAVRSLREEIDSLRRAVKADLEGLNSKQDEMKKEIKQLKKKLSRISKSRR